MKTNETRRVLKKDKSLGERGEMALGRKSPVCITLKMLKSQTKKYIIGGYNFANFF